MRLSPTGRYDQITIRISEDMPEDSCETILTNIKVRNTFGNRTFYMFKLSIFSDLHKLVHVNLIMFMFFS